VEEVKTLSPNDCRENIHS